VDAASLYGLAKIAPDVAKEQARELLDQQNPVHWLVRETAEQVLTNSELLGFHSSNANEQLSVKVSTLIARVAAMGKIQEFIFQQPEVRVGRSPVNDIVISDLRVLQQHAVFAVNENGVIVIDLTSSTGLRAGDLLIKGDRLRLNQGDTVRFCRLAEPAITIHWEQRAIKSKHPRSPPVNLRGVFTLDFFRFRIEFKCRHFNLNRSYAATKTLSNPGRSHNNSRSCCGRKSSIIYKSVTDTIGDRFTGKNLADSSRTEPDTGGIYADQTSEKANIILL